MHIIDLHCDTLYKAATEKIALNDVTAEVKLNESINRHKLQCYAIWLPDSLSGHEAEKLFFHSYNILKAECDRLGIALLTPERGVCDVFYQHKNIAYFTVENGLALNGKLDNVKAFSNLGVRMMTLTWNSSNLIGDGAEVKNARGITDFGKAVVREMERYDIVVDISHASEKLFYDVIEIAERPFVASHSNSFSVTSHRRNLTDNQFKIIRDRGGLVGLNFHNAFLNRNPEEANVYDIIRHAEHFLSLGGEDVLCFGSDFDGGILPKDIADSSVYDKIFEIFLQENYKEALIRKIFYENTLNFFENFDNQRNMV